MKKNILRALIWALGGMVVVVAAIWGYRKLDTSATEFDVVITPDNIPADGASSALLEIRIISRFGNRLNVRALPHAPVVELTEGAHLVRLIPLGDSLSYRLVAGAETGTVVAQVRIYGLPAPVETQLHLTPSLADKNRNGYPDAIDLTSQSDRTSFRRWFTTIALGQLTHIDDRWHDRDCAGLIRYCYREALKRHDNAWLSSRKWLITGAIPDVRKYNYPNVPLVGTKVFNAGSREPERGEGVRGREGEREIRPARNLSERESMVERFSEYAEAARLKDNSLGFFSRDPEEALPGDILFYLNDTDSEWPYHTMVYLGGGMTVYHTGPDGDAPGIVKRLSLAELSRHPNPRWHPVASNPYFLGFYRWRILM